MKPTLLVYLSILTLPPPLFGAPRQASKLGASQATQGDFFGLSASLHGKRAVVGAKVFNNGTGSSYFFDGLDLIAGFQTEQLRPTVPNLSNVDSFGSAVSLSSSALVVTAPGRGNGGEAFFFRISGIDGTTWNHALKLIPSPAVTGSRFGSAVSLQNIDALIGAENPNGTGIAYYFDNLNTSGTRTQNVTLTSNDGASGDYFGSAVSLGSNSGLVGAKRSSAAGNSANRQGAAYFYKFQWPFPNTKTQDAKLIPTDRANNHQFGTAVSLSGDTAVVGSPGAGAAYLFRDLAAATGTKYQNAKLGPSDKPATMDFGYSVSHTGDDALIGSFDSNSTGSVYLFRDLANAFGDVTNPTTEAVKIVATRGSGVSSSYRYFGVAVSLSGDRFLIGERSGDGNANQSGVAYSGTISSLTQLDAGNTEHFIDHISFESRGDWVIGDTTSANKVTLQPLNHAQVNAGGTAVHIGRNPGSDNNRLAMHGKLTANYVFVGSADGNRDNTLELVNTSDIAGISNIMLVPGNKLQMDGNFTNMTILLAKLGTTRIQVLLGGNWTMVTSANISQTLNATFVAGRTFITPRATPYQSWVSEYFPIGDPRAQALADPDGDGFANVFEYLFDNKPNSNISRPTLHLEKTSSGGQLTLYIKPRSDLAWDVQTSGDLHLWTSIDPGAADDILTYPDGSQRLRFLLTGPTRSFARIRITSVPESP